MPVIYPKKIRQALASIDIERLKDEIIKLGFDYIREGGFKPNDEPFKFSNYIFYTHPESKISLRIGHYTEDWLNKNIFEICYSSADINCWLDITPDFRKTKWRNIRKNNGGELTGCSPQLCNKK